MFFKILSLLRKVKKTVFGVDSIVKINPLRLSACLGNPGSLPA